LDPDEIPELVAFFCRPESMCGLHQLTRFITGDNEPVKSAVGAGCATLITWPLHYLERGEDKAVIGGWDPSARKYLKADELSFTVSWQMFLRMIEKWESSFLTTKTWSTVRKRIKRTKEAWGEIDNRRA
jgi:hypothetical protein